MIAAFLAWLDAKAAAEARHLAWIEANKGVWNG